jgi:hypothetical protein
VTLTETAAGSHIYVSKALMLVSDDVDARQATHSGFTAGADAGLRRRGQSNHRLRRAALDGSVRADYNAAGGAAVAVTLPVFQRSPSDLRRRVTVNVVHYGITVNAAVQRQIDEQFRRANRRWAQTGLRIDAGPAIARAIPPAASDGNGNYAGSGQNAAETAALRDLSRVIPDRTVTVVFTRFPPTGPDGRRPDGLDPFNAYATLNHRGAFDIGERYFIFLQVDVDPNDETLGHELHHVLFNRGDDIANIPARRFFTFATDAPLGHGIPLPDVRIYRRVQMLHGDPDADPNNDAVHNWVRRRRTRRFNQPGNTLPGALDAPDPTTGNILTVAF